MSKIYKSARGKLIDIDKIKLANESAIAVGNMKVNARGDKLGPGGQVVATRNQVMDQVYNVPSAGYSPNDPSIHADQQAIIEANQAQATEDLAQTLSTPSTPDVPSTPAARGSLANTVKKSK